MNPNRELLRVLGRARVSDWTCPKCQATIRANHGGFVSHTSACGKSSERFWAKVGKGEPDECWLYNGFRKWDGYGWLSRRSAGKTRYLTAHRMAWIDTNGEPGVGLHVLHRCDNPPCCNPAHLFLGTHLENMADRVAKGRHKMGTIFKDRVRPVREDSHFD